MPTKKRKGRNEEPNFIGIHHSFTTNLYSLEVFVKNVAPIAAKQDKAATKEITRAVNQLSQLIKTEEKNKRTSAPKLDNKKILQEIYSIAKKLPHIPLAQAELLYRSSFIMLISYFDFLLSDLIHYFYKKYPDSLSGKELPLKLSELKLLGSIDDAVDYVVHKEAESVLYDSLKGQIKYLKNTLKIDTKDNIINWNKLTESMERRHITVHNDCKINRRYLNNVDLSQIPEKTKGIKEGTKIRITEKYFRGVLEEICVAGLVLLQVCWRKWEGDDTGDADTRLITDIYDILVKEDWACAERLGLFSKECDVKDHADRLILDINYCQSLKWQGKQDKLEEEIKKFDISALSPRFILAVCALKSDRDGFYSNVENAIVVDGMQEEHFMEWPLFRELRKDADYGDKIHSILTSISAKRKTTH